MALLPAELCTGPHGEITDISGPKKLIVVASINLLFSYLEFET